MPQPQIFRISRKRGRKFGRYDSWKYETILSESSLAMESLEQVTIDCRFRLEKSKWGVLTEERHPGGIIYLDLTFQQPGDHRLKYATVTVTLDDDSKDLIQLLPAPGPSDDAKVPVRIGEYGPTQIMGEAKNVHKTVEHQAAPEIGVGGYINVGNMGRKSERDFNQEYRWTFSSQKKPAKKDSPHYQVLKWTITENKLDPHSYHSNTIHTAFAFRHGGQPFLIRVGIEGSLRNKFPNLWHKFSSLRDQRFATTLVNFNGGERFTKVLDQIAERLPAEMERENTLKVPVEVKDPQKPMQGPEASEETGQPLLVNDNIKDYDTIGEKIGQYVPADEYPTLKAIADTFKFVSTSYKPSRGQDGLSQSHRHTRSPKSKVGVVDEPDVIDQHSAQETSKPITEGQENNQENNQNGTTHTGELLLGHQDASCKLKTDFSDITKALKIYWKLLLQYMLQVLGLMLIVSVVAKRLTYDGGAAVSATAIRSTPSTSEGP
ncbi:hypothetical protein GGR51DRAFT_537469 [Nemania sp. FL0031]|nr:hypothetical protein GGR51DRAFT_537469 [Nemania sp. FL0031]